MRCRPAVFWLNISEPMRSPSSGSCTRSPGSAGAPRDCLTLRVKCVRSLARYSRESQIAGQGILGLLKLVAVFEHFAVAQIPGCAVPVMSNQLATVDNRSDGYEVGRDDQGDALLLARLDLAVHQVIIGLGPFQYRRLAIRLRIALRGRRLDPRIELPAERRLARPEPDRRAVQADGLQVQVELAGERVAFLMLILPAATDTARASCSSLRRLNASSMFCWSRTGSTE